MREFPHTGYEHNTIRMESESTDEIYLNCSHIVIASPWLEGTRTRGWEILLVTGETIRLSCFNMTLSGIPEALQAVIPRGD